MACLSLCLSLTSAYGGRFQITPGSSWGAYRSTIVWVNITNGSGSTNCLRVLDLCPGITVPVLTPAVTLILGITEVHTLLSFHYSELTDLEQWAFSAPIIQLLWYFVKVPHLQGDSREDWQEQVSNDFTMTQMSWAGIFRTRDSWIQAGQALTTQNWMSWGQPSVFMTLVGNTSGSLMFCFSRFKEAFSL